MQVRLVPKIEGKLKIQNILRFGSLRGKRKDPSLIDKLKNWPSSILRKPLSLGTEVMTRIERFIEIRHDLTHPKRRDNTIYRTLEEIESGMVVATVAEYIAQFHSAQGTCFPYWLSGWNYLNPRHGDYEIVLVNDQQFVFSMMGLGDPVRASSPQESEAWKGRYMNGYAGYCSLAARLDSLVGCEPKDIRFPHKPVLCRRWWLPEHHLTCGNVTAASIEAAKRHYREVRE